MPRHSADGRAGGGVGRVPDSGSDSGSAWDPPATAEPPVAAPAYRP